MKKLSNLFSLIIPFLLLNFYTTAQTCNINTCPSGPLLSIDAPIFDNATSAIILNNVTFGELNCTAASWTAGLDIYIYQLLPDGSRMELCNVLNDPPYNVIGHIPVAFGQAGDFCGNSLNIGTVSASLANGFEACDGAVYEVEAALYVTDNTAVDNTTSIYTQLNANEYFIINVGTVEVNINNEFPGGGQPLTTAIINELATGSNGPISASCGDDVDLYVEGISRLANCIEFDDIFSGIPSELTNEFYYSINGEAPVIIQDPSTGAAGGQLTGPDPNLGDVCYAGILGTYTLLWADLPQDLCDNSTIVVTIITTDIFTGVTLQDEITINYSGASCTNCVIDGCTDPTACNYDSTATDDDGSCMPVPVCNTDICAGDTEIIDPNDACACITDVVQVLGCTDVNACNYNISANCDDGNCDAGNAVCADPCNPVMGCTDAGACNYNMMACEDDGSCTFAPCNPGCTDPCADNYDATADGDDGSCDPYDMTCNTDCTLGDLQVWDATSCACVTDVVTVLGCTDVTACNYNAAANCDDSSCDAGNTACVDPCNPAAGCTDAAACNFDMAACIDDGSCAFAPCNPGCTDPCADNYDATADEDNGSCNPYDTTCNTDCTAGDLSAWDAASCSCVVTTVTVLGCTDMAADNYDATANCDNGSCIIDPGCTVTAATISGGPFQFCVGDGTSDFVSGITVSGGTGTNTAWVITDEQLNILDLPGMPDEVDFDTGFGTCLIWYITYEDLTGAAVGANAADLTGCFALSNSIEVIRDDCGPCEEEISGAIVAAEGCDVGNITISIIFPDGGMTNVVTQADGTFIVPGGPYPCGDYIAAFLDPNELPLCYRETGSTEPIDFTLDGVEGDDIMFLGNPTVPTLSQWGLIILALLLMTFGALALSAKNSFLSLNKAYN